MRERIRNMDSNGDGLISLDEASQGMRQQFPNMDLDSSGSLDDSEIESMLERRFPNADPGGAGQPQGFNPRSIKERILNSDANGDEHNQRGNFLRKCSAASSKWMPMTMVPSMNLKSMRCYETGPRPKHGLTGVLAPVRFKREPAN